jgi:hypothetical protein
MMRQGVSLKSVRAREFNTQPIAFARRVLEADGHPSSDVE